MRYLKTYESISNYSVDVLTAGEFRKLFNELYPYNYNLKDIIKYFSWNIDGGSQKHHKSSRLITAYNDKEILGICFFAWWEASSTYSVSYNKQ